MSNEFKGCDSETVFKQVRSKLANAEERTLWGSMREEITRVGISGGISYLEGEFTRISAQLRREIERIKADQPL
jgi:hypothetical protein